MTKQWYRVDLSGVVVVEAESEDDAIRQGEDATAEEAGLFVAKVKPLTDDEIAEHWGGDKDRIAAMFREDNRMQVALKRAKKMLEQRGIFIKGMDVFTPQFQVSMIENALKTLDADTTFPIPAADGFVNRPEEIPYKVWREGLHGGVPVRLIEVSVIVHPYLKPTPLIVQTWDQSSSMWRETDRYPNIESANADLDRVLDKDE